MWAMIFLPSYTMGGIGAGRLLNVVWMTFILGLAVTEFLLFGWLERIRGVCLTPPSASLAKQGSACRWFALRCWSVWPASAAIR